MPASARLLPLSLGLGALYDALFGLALLAWPAAAAAGLRVPLPGDELYLRFIGVFLMILALMYALPARDPDRYRGVAAVAVVGRLLGCFFLAGAVLLYARPPVFLLLAGADGAFALLHAVGLRLRPAPRDVPL